VAFLRKLAQGWGRVALVLIALAGVSLLTMQLSLPSPSVPLANIPTLSLDGTRRLLVLAPHCDDETLSSAGLILAAERAGIQVRVVIATNGDGFYFATMQDFKTIYPTHADFVRMGELRQQESLTALGILGVQADQVSFLSYPDRGTPSMWETDWSATAPYRSPYSGDTRSPYPITYDPASVYAGQDYLTDLRSILASYRPDLIVYPNPSDVHPDHWGLSAFTRLAITLEQHADPSYQPRQLTYLVHRPDFPEIRGYFPQDPLTPPDILYQLEPDWYRLDLTPADESLKGQAVHAYRSQMPLLHTLLESFMRTDEIFAPLPDTSLPTLASGNPLDPATWLDASGGAIAPVERDPVGDFITRSALPAGDLTAVYTARDTQGNLQLCAQVNEDTLPEITYLLRMKVLAGDNILSWQARSGAAPAGWAEVHRSGPYACSSLPAAQLGDPWAVYVGATTVSAGRIEDESAWRMLSVQP
jgi:N-acetyl-1-D-myo-inositol-2-amino-2-deoxy-alpha-D-glucopyranoside deacetylase